jgi:hypothetical protein
MSAAELEQLMTVGNHDSVNMGIEHEVEMGLISSMSPPKTITCAKRRGSKGSDRIGTLTEAAGATCKFLSIFYF